MRYRNEQPEPLPLNEPPAQNPCPTEGSNSGTLPPSQTSTRSDETPLIPDPAGQEGRQKSPEPKCNKFGLFRNYRSDVPSHDPDSEAQVIDILESPKSDDDPLFRPYPNKTAFLLGEWYWNGGLQKTKEGFKNLVNIICDESFNPSEIRNIRWDNLNKYLGGPTNSEDAWFDDPDAEWTETVISLPFPFKKKSVNAGVHEYTFPPFRHRKIVSVLKEKMANKNDFQQFHLEPYELRWCQSKDMSQPDSTSTRVHGELYTSPAFIEENVKIQTAPGEPGCPLPRILVGLIFASDGTKLTSFGSASLWPCYMYFGNESKYRRNKPNQNLCNHIAFFIDVRY